MVPSGNAGRARAHFVGDLVICVLWNGFTVVEQTLLAAGEAYMSQIHLDPDVAVEVFMLEPAER